MGKNTTGEAAQDSNMITHYGLFWSERSVFWGRQRNRGELLGRSKPKTGRRGASTKEQREEKQRDYRNFVGIYSLYGGGDLLYVGEAGLGTKKTTLFSRLNSHRKGPMSGRWDKFSWFGCERLDEEGPRITHKTALAQLEAILISITNPRFNKQSGTFAKADQVYQVAHPEADGDMADKLRKMEERMEKMLNEIKETVNPTNK